MIKEMKTFISSLFQNEDSKTQVQSNPYEDIYKKKKTLTSIFKYTTKDFDNVFQTSSGFKEQRKKFMTKNMDNLIELIKQEHANQEFLARTISNIAGKISKKRYTFLGTNPEKVKKVSDKFKEILKNSNYNENSYFKELLINFVKFSNNFTVPISNDENKLERILVMQNIGWHVHEKIGNCYAKSFYFEPEEGIRKLFKNETEVWHYTFNKESDEIFAMPLWIPVIPTLKKYKYLLSATIDSYSDQSIERIIYEIGVTKNGGIRQVNPDTHDEIKDLLASTDDDLIVDAPVNANVISKHFTSPDKILETLKQQAVAGLYTSENQLGISNSGRQDAEMQTENTMITAEDFLNDLELQINQTFIKRICVDLFGNYIGENDIELKFEENFDIKERKEKHAVYLFQSGITDLDETRKACSLDNEIQKNKTFFELYQQKEMSGTVESTNNPKNQYKPNGTGTTKKTKKDKKEVDKCQEN